MPKRRINYRNHKVGGSYSSKVSIGRSDTYHAKIVVDSVDYFPYFPQRGTTSAGNGWTQAYDIPMNSPLDSLFISSIGTASNSFAQTVTTSYWVPLAAMQYSHEQLALLGKYYERFRVSSNKIEFFFKAQPVRMPTVQVAGGSGGYPPVVTDYALNGPSEITWSLIGVGPNQQHSEFTTQRTIQQQPGCKTIRMSRGPGTSSNLSKANYGYISGFSSLTKWRGKAYDAQDGGYLQNISAGGQPSSTYPLIRPKWILACTWRTSDDNPDGLETKQWSILCRVRNTFWCTFQLRRTYPNPTLSLLSEEEQKVLLLRRETDPGLDVDLTASLEYLKKMGKLIEESKDEVKGIGGLNIGKSNLRNPVRHSVTPC